MTKPLALAANIPAPPLPVGKRIRAGFALANLNRILIGPKEAQEA